MKKMNIKKAVSNRIIELCKDNNITINELANIAGISPTTIYSIIGTKSLNPGIITLKKICDGFGITIVEFFDTEEFRTLEQELK